MAGQLHSVVYSAAELLSLLWPGPGGGGGFKEKINKHVNKGTVHKYLEWGMHTRYFLALQYTSTGSKI
jgi:hypothetical protein